MSSLNEIIIRVAKQAYAEILYCFRQPVQFQHTNIPMKNTVNHITNRAFFFRDKQVMFTYLHVYM